MSKITVQYDSQQVVDGDVDNGQFTVDASGRRKIKKVEEFEELLNGNGNNLFTYLPQTLFFDGFIPSIIEYFKTVRGSQEPEASKTRLVIAPGPNEVVAVADVIKKLVGNDLKVLVVPTKEQVCINAEVRQLKSISSGCNTRTKANTRNPCYYWKGSNHAEPFLKEKKPLINFLDIEELVNVGTRSYICPYFASREMFDDVDIIILPRVYLKVDKDGLLIYRQLLKDSIVIYQSSDFMLDVLDGALLDDRKQKMVDIISYLTNQMKLMDELTREEELIQREEFRPRRMIIYVRNHSIFNPEVRDLYRSYNFDVHLPEYRKEDECPEGINLTDAKTQLDNFEHLLKDNDANFLFYMHQDVQTFYENVIPALFKYFKNIRGRESNVDIKPRLLIVGTDDDGMNKVAKIVKYLIQSDTSNTNNKFKAIELSSRKILCINPDVNELADVNGGCERRIKDSDYKVNSCNLFHGHGRHFTSFLEASGDGVDVLDIEELVKVGVQNEICPYFASREVAMTTADIIITPFVNLVHDSSPINGHKYPHLYQNSIVFFESAGKLLKLGSSDFRAAVDDVQKAVIDEKIEFITGFNPRRIILHTSSHWTIQPAIRDILSNSFDIQVVLPRFKLSWLTHVEPAGQDDAPKTEVAIESICPSTMRQKVVGQGDNLNKRKTENVAIESIKLRAPLTTKQKLQRYSFNK